MLGQSLDDFGVLLRQVVRLRDVRGEIVELIRLGKRFAQLVVSRC